MIIRKKGFTLIELMIGLILITLIITALWDVYSSSRRNANEIIANHTLNSEIEMILMRIADDLRESNAINASYPTILLPTEVEDEKELTEEELLQRIIEYKQYKEGSIKLKDLYDNNKEELKNYTKILYSQARLIEGLPIENPTEISNLICEIMSK